MAVARARSSPRNSCASKASETANMMAPPTPCSAREQLSISGPVERAHSAEAMVKTTSPITNTRLRPSRSASEPLVSTNAASVSA